MKKISYTIIGLLALIAVGFAVYFAFINVNDPFSAEESDDTVEVEQPEEARDIIQVTEEDPNETEPDELSIPRQGNDFVDLELTLDAEFPSAPDDASIFEDAHETRLSTDEMLEIGRQFGFSGELYADQFEEQDDTMAEGEILEDNGDYDPSMHQSYYMFEGEKRLNFYSNSVSYIASSGGDYFGNPFDENAFISYEEALPIAESFLLDADLLPDNYVTKKSWGGSVQFLELIDGIVFNRPVATVVVAADGEILSVEYTSLITLTESERMAVDSAETSWELLVENPGLYEFNFLPDQMDPYSGDFAQPKFWNRDIADGTELTRSVWYQVAKGVDSDDMIILFENTELTGSAEIIDQLVENSNRSTEITGYYETVDGIKKFHVTEVVDNNGLQNDVYLSGNILKEGADTKLVVAGGLTLLLPDAPEDIEDNLSVSVYGFSISDNDEGTPVFNWQSMNEQMDYEMMEEEMESHDPFSIKELTIIDIELVYHYFFPVNVMRSVRYEPNELFVPTWQFSGVTEGGTTLEFWVPAVDTNQIGN